MLKLKNIVNILSVMSFSICFAFGNNTIWSNPVGGNSSSSNTVQSDFNLINARLDWEYKLPDKNIYSLSTTNNELVCIANDPDKDQNGTLYCFALFDGKLKWKQKLGAISARACTTGDSIIISGYNIVKCLNSSDGSKRWEYKVDNPVDNSAAPIPLVVVANGCVYFFSLDGNLYCIDYQTQKLNWVTPMYTFGLFIYNNKIITYWIKDFKVLDVKTGNLLSKYPFEVIPNKFSTPDKYPTVGNNKFIYWEDDTLYCHDLTDGKLLWKNNYSKPGKSYISSTYSVTESGYVLVGASFDYKPLICLDAKTGKEIWSTGERRFDSGSCSFPTIVNDKIYMVHDYGYISIYDLKDGKEIFNKELYDAIQNSDYLPVVGNRIIFNHRGDYKKNELVLQCYRDIASKLIFIIDSNKMIYDNDIKTIDATPKIIKGITYIPARYIIDSFGGKVGFRIDEGGYFAYDPKKGFYITNEPQRKIVEAELGKNKLELVINSNTATLNNNQVVIDKKDLKITPIIINGRTMVPLRFLAESLGCKVEWKPNTKEIIVTYQP